MTDTTELVARLREWDHCWPARWLDTAVPQAADTIERLTRERDEAQRENMDMVWQRRSAEFRAEAAEARIAKLEAALDSLLRDQHGRL